MTRTAGGTHPHPAWVAIFVLITSISETCYGADVAGAEYEVWRLVTAGGSCGGRDAAEVRRELDALIALVNITGVWVVWGSPDILPVPIAEWKEMYDDWALAHEERNRTLDAQRSHAPRHVTAAQVAAAAGDGDTHP